MLRSGVGFFSSQSHGPRNPFFPLYEKQKETFILLAERQARVRGNDPLSLWVTCAWDAGAASPLHSYVSFAFPEIVQDKSRSETGSSQ